MRSYGIMQGRLTPSKGRGIQFFPFENWQNEFALGEKIGIQEIEWVFDYPGYSGNPIWSKEGLEKIRGIISTTGVCVRSVCFDYFMRRPFYKSADAGAGVRKENIEFIKRLIAGMNEIGAHVLEIPFVDGSSLKTGEERKQAVEFLQEILSFAEGSGVLIGCETDLPAGAFRDFLDEIQREGARANYDSGNSSGLGYNHRDEILSLSEYIANVHIKDRLLHGSTVPLGTGSADFETVFSSLKAIGYKDSIILQAFRGKDGEERADVCCQLSFVKGYCKKYGME